MKGICKECGASDTVTNCDKCGQRTCIKCVTVNNMNIYHTKCFRRPKK